MTRPVLAAWLVLILGLALRCCGAVPVHAQSDDGLLVARLCVHEAGFDSPDDCAGIYAVLARGAERHHIALAAFARRYSPRFTAGTSARPWARALADTDAPPHGLSVALWRRPRGEGSLSRRDAFAALLLRCRELVAAPPAIAVDDWGSAQDHERARLSGRRFVIVDVGATRNLFSRRVRR